MLGHKPNQCILVFSQNVRSRHRNAILYLHEIFFVFYDRNQNRYKSVRRTLFTSRFEFDRKQTITIASSRFIHVPDRSVDTLRERIVVPLDAFTRGAPQEARSHVYLSPATLDCRCLDTQDCLQFARVVTI
jgi:hypothetical protein